MQQLKAAALLSGPVILLLLAAALVGGPLIWWIATGLAVCIFAVLWRADSLVLRSLRAERLEEQAAPGLFAIIRTLTRRLQLSYVGVYVLPNEAPNALVIAGPSKVSCLVVTSGLLHLLDSNQLAGVLAHHLSLVESGAAFGMSVAACCLLFLDRVPGAGLFHRGLVRFISPASLKIDADAASTHLIGDALPLLGAFAKIASSSRLAIAPAVGHLCLIDPQEMDGLLASRMARISALSGRPLPCAAE